MSNQVTKTVIINTNNINKKANPTPNKDFTDMTLSDMWDAATWDNTCDTAEEAYDATVDAITNTSLSDVGNNISSGWESVCSWFSSDDK